MADSFWLYDGTNTLVLDSTVQEINIGGIKRDYNVKEYSGAPGGQIRGFGVPGPRKFMVTRLERAEGTDINFWNSRRNDFVKWATKARYETVYLYIRNGEDNLTVRARCYPSVIGSDKSSFFKITDEKEFELLIPDGLFSDIATTTENKTITNGTPHTLNITNNGTWEAPGQFKFTPTADESLFQVEIGDQFGFRLESSPFTAGKQIVYDTYDNSLTVAGVPVQLSQFLTKGSVFNIPQGDSTLNILTSGAGSFQLTYNARYV